MKRVPVSCNLDCGGGCALIAAVDDGKIVSIRDNPERPADTVGCGRGYHAADAMLNPYRIGTPLVRSGPRGSGEFRAVSWDEAFDVVTDGLGSVVSKHGESAVFGLAGAGACRGSVHNTTLLTRRFLSCIADGYTGTHGSYSSAAQSFVLPYLFGSGSFGIDPATLEDTNLVILWGANICDTRFGADFETVLRRLHARRVPIVSIDPRQSHTTRVLADEWIPILPGTDSALMSAILYVLIEENLVDRRFIQAYTSGFDRLEAMIMHGKSAEPEMVACRGVPQSPENLERVSGVPSDTVRRLARVYAKARPAALISGLSIQRTVGGEEAVRLAVTLQAATGNIGVPGGAPGCCPWGLLPPPRFGRISGIAPGRQGPSGSVPIYRWADAILGNEPLPGGSLRAAYIVGANYLVTGSDISKNVRALESLEFSVCHDTTLTPTARYCDVVLPATTFLEREDVVFPAGNYLYYSAKACEPFGEAMNDYDIFAALSGRMHVDLNFTEGRSSCDWLARFLGDSGIPDPAEFIRTGVHDAGDHRRIGLCSYVADPRANPLTTPSGRIELVSDSYARTGGPAVPVFREDMTGPNRSGFSLRMITPHARYRINSQNAIAPWANDREPQVLSIHPDDAAARSIVDGALVEVKSAIGSVRVPARVTEGIRSGVVSLPAGMWPSMSGEVKCDEVGECCPASGNVSAGAANFLTSTEPTMPSMGSRTHMNFVEVGPVR